MTDLTEFLLARIAEDEADARTAEDTDFLGPQGAEQAADRLLSRVLAECEAKRQIVQMCDDYVSEYENEAYRTIDGYTAGRVAGRSRSWRDETMCALAQPYADHPDFRPEWALTKETP